MSRPLPILMIQPLSNLQNTAFQEIHLCKNSVHTQFLKLKENKQLGSQNHSRSGLTFHSSIDYSQKDAIIKWLRNSGVKS